MNQLLLNFCLMLFWASIALYLLVLGPWFAPDMMPAKGRGQTVGFAAALLAIWNFVRYFSARAAARQRAKLQETYGTTVNPLKASTEPKPIVNPDFQFDEAAKPPAPPNGKPQ